MSLLGYMLLQLVYEHGQFRDFSSLFVLRKVLMGFKEIYGI